MREWPARDGWRFTEQPPLEEAAIQSRHDRAIQNASSQQRAEAFEPPPAASGPSNPRPAGQGPAATTTRRISFDDSEDDTPPTSGPTRSIPIQPRPSDLPLEFDFATAHEAFNLDFSSLDDTDVLENFDFDSFLDPSYNGPDGPYGVLAGGEAASDSWRSTVAAVNPNDDVSRPRPRPK
jgi:hypothetical protein